MKSHLRYLGYVLRHKWYVFIECCRLGILWQGVVHDRSKFSSAEWKPYVETFYGTKNPRDATGAYDPAKVSPEFDKAWLHHVHCNPHHWQYWVLIGDNGSQKVLEMPLPFRKEMLADWRGAGRAQGKPDTQGWYLKNQTKMLLGDQTRLWICDALALSENCVVIRPK